MINAKELYHDDSLKAFFDQVTKKNPNILLGHDKAWARLFTKDKETFIRLASKR